MSKVLEVVVLILLIFAVGLKRVDAAAPSRVRAAPLENPPIREGTPNPELADRTVMYRELEEDAHGLTTIREFESSLLGKDRLLDLQTCLRLALERNREILASDKAIDVAYWKSREAHRGGIPVVKYEYRFAPVPRDMDDPLQSFFGGEISVFNSLKIEVGAPIVTFGQVTLARVLGQLGVSESLVRKGDTISDVAVKIYQLYYGLLLANEVTQLMDKAVTAIEDNIEKAEEEEYVDQVQLLKFRTITFELYKQLDESRRKQELAKRALRIQIGYGQDSDIDFKISKLTPLEDDLKKYDVYLSRAYSEGSKQSLLNLGIEAKKTLHQLEKRKLAPSLGWGGFFEIGYAPGIENEDDASFDRPFNFKRAGIGLQLAGSFDWPTARSRIHQAEAEYYKVLLQKPAVIEGIELEVREAYLDAIEKRNLMERSENARVISRQIVFLTKSNLDIGVGEKKDYTDALQSYLLFQGRYYEAVYNYNMALVKLKRLSGTLNDDIRRLVRVGASRQLPTGLRPLPDTAVKESE